MRFEFPFNLIGKSTMTFLTGQSWRVLKSWYTVGYPEQGFRRCFEDRLVSVSSQAAQAHYVWVLASEVIWSEYTRIISVLFDAK